MLRISDLRQFSDNYITTRANLEKSIVVADDDEVSKLIQNIANDGDNCTLITVLPTHDPNFEDEDNKEMLNNLIFMVVKKTDTKGGNDLRLANFELCQIEIQELFNHILKIIDTEENCSFRKIDYGPGAITPISDYFGQNGYMLEFTSKTQL